MEKSEGENNSNDRVNVKTWGGFLRDILESEEERKKK